MRKHTDSGIVLARTNFGEKDRILTVLARHHGKIKLIAKSVRSARSKLAGGIELFSESDLGWVEGRSEIYTLTSSRLKTHFGNIISDLEKTDLAYDILKTVNKNSDDGHGQEYYDLLLISLRGLNSPKIAPGVLKIWFVLELLRLQGTAVNLKTDSQNKKLEESSSYNFDFSRRCFLRSRNGKYGASHLKFLRLLNSLDKPRAINVEGKVLKDCLNLAEQVMHSDQDKV